MRLDLVSISETIDTLRTDFFAGLGASQTKMNDPPPFAKVAERGSQCRNLKDLRAMPANGPNTPSEVREIGVDLAGNKLAPMIIKKGFQRGNLFGTA